MIADKVPPRAILIPPGILLSTRSSALSWVQPEASQPFSDWRFRCPWAGLLDITDTMIARFGADTPAPWAPPQRLVVWGVYRHLRNPMISCVFCVLLADALALQSLLLLAWMAVFIAANMIYIPNAEGPGLGKRFGESRRIHEADVPRWQPLVTPWKSADDV